MDRRSKRALDRVSARADLADVARQNLLPEERAGDLGVVQLAVQQDSHGQY
jgi:hypothetical protein